MNGPEVRGVPACYPNTTGEAKTPSETNPQDLDEVPEPGAGQNTAFSREISYSRNLLPWRLICSVR
jgi:hypothetical protein